jgi:hypothetical protein
MATINRSQDDSLEKKEKRDPEDVVDEGGNDSDGVLSFTALVEEGES